jgi:hypothetical protein
MVVYDEKSLPPNPRLGISVEFESGPELRSTLTIRKSGASDAGNYTCKPSNAIPASVQVFVSEGDKIKQKVFAFYSIDFCTSPDRQSEPLLKQDVKERGASQVNDFITNVDHEKVNIELCSQSSIGCLSSMASCPPTMISIALIFAFLLLKLR